MISSIEDDHRYHKFHHLYKILKDDEELEYCFTADTLLGIAYCYKVDKNNNILFANNQPIIVKHYGRIKIRLK